MARCFLERIRPLKLTLQRTTGFLSVDYFSLCSEFSHHYQIQESLTAEQLFEQAKFSYLELELNRSEFLSSLACECAKQAKAGGYAGFALHYYGECYGRTNAEIQNIQTNGGHQQHLCVGDQKYDKCDTSAHDHCTGGNYAEGVYAFKAAADPGKSIDPSPLFMNSK